MRTNGAFRRPGPTDRFREWWYRQKPSARVNKLLYLAAAVAAVAFVNAANRDTTTPASGLAARVPQPTLAAPSTTAAPTTLPSTTSSPSTLAVTSTVARKPAVTVRPTTTVPTVTISQPPSTPPPVGGPGVIFSPTPGTLFPPITAPSTTTTAPRPTTTVPTTIGPIPSSSTPTSRA